MKRLAVVVCNSGLGHIKRVLYLIDLLCQRSPDQMEISVFVDLTKLRKFATLIDKFKVRPWVINSGISSGWFIIRHAIGVVAPHSYGQSRS